MAVGGSGNVFVADTGNNAVKEILAAGGYTTVNKLGAGFSGPQGVALDGSGNVFVADTGNNAMKEILAANGYTEVVPLVGTGLSGPSGLVLDGSGNIFVADTGNNAVKEILAAGGYTTVNTLSSGFSGPQGVALDGSGDLFVADGRGAWELWTTSVNLGTVSIGTTSAVATLTFTFDTGGTVAAPMVLTQGAAGLDFADAGTGTCTTNGTSYTYSAGDTCTVSVKFAPTHPGQRDGAVELLDNSGNLLATGYVWGIGTGPQAIFANTTSGDYLPSVQSLLGSGFNNPDSVAVDGSGNVFVADSGNAAVYEITQASGYTTVNTLGSGFGQPWGVAVDGAGNVFVADATNGAVYEITQASGYTTVNTLGSGFYSPTGVAVDGSGNVFVADIANVAVYEITQASGYNTVNTLGGGFSEPEGVAVDGSGNVFVTDFYAAAVKEIPPGCTSSSCVQTLGGVVTNPYGVAVDATGNVFVTYVNFNAVAEITRASGYTAGISLGSGFQEPTGVVVDGSGNVYVANNRGQVMRLDFSDTPSLSFANTLAGSTSSDSPQTVTVTNDGNAALTFTTLSYPADFPEGDGDTNACTTSNSLNAGLACDLPVNFIPQTTSSLSESLTLTDNTLNASPSVTQSISLSGTGTVPSPASQLVFGVAPAAIVTPGGNAGSAVTVLEEDAGGNVSAEAADTITLTVTYPDTTTQTYTAAAVSGVATFNLSGAALTQPGSYTYTASFTGLTSAMALEIVAPPASTAPATSVGTPSATQTATMYLNSSFTLGSIAVLTQGAPSSNNTDFQTAAGGTCAVGTAYTAGETCTVNYTFNPQHPGPRYGAVVLYDNASPANTVVTVYLQGTGEGAQAVFSSNNIQSVLGSGYGNPAGVAVDASGNVFVADVATSAVTEILAAGGYTTVNTLGSGFANPSSVAVDGAGNVFVADANNNAVKEILAAGGYTTVNTLGSGFNTPQGVAVDGAGNVFVADTWNNAVKEILAAGGYTTVLTLGSGFGGPDSVAVDGAGNVFVGDTANNAVKEILAAGGYTTVKTLGSGFDNPWGVAVDASGNVFVADAVNSAVKEILAAGGYTTVLTLGSGFYVPFGVALDGAGNVIVADSLNAAVKKLDFSDGPSLSFAPTPGGTIGTDSPQTVTVANDGNQPLTFSAVSYAADFPEAPGVATDCTTTTPVASGASCTLSIDFLPSAPSDTGDVPLTESIEITDNTAASQSVMTVNGTETAPPPAQLVFGVAPAAVIGVGGNAGSAVTVEEEDAVGSLLPELTNTITLTVTGPNSYSQTYTATAVGGVATFNLSGAALTQPGNYTWTASYAALTSAVASETVVSAAILAPATGVGTPSATQTVTVYLNSNFTLGSIAVLTQGAPNLDFQAAAGGTCAIGTAYTAVETCTVNYTFDPKHPGPRYGAVVLYDNASPANAVATVYLQGTGEGPQAIFSSNNIQIALGSGLSSPAGVAADASGNVFVADADNNAVKEILAAGGYTTVNTLGGGFSRPAGVAVDGVGNVFVADTDNNAVKEIPPGCILSSCVKTLGSGFSDPYGVAVDGAGNVFVADSANNAVKEILAAGGYTTVNTLNSSFSLPFGVAVDGSGNVFVADTFNSAVKEILAAGGYTTVKTLGSGFSNPFGVAVDGNGNVFVADTFNSAVKEILAAGGYTAVKTLGSGFTNPYGVAVDGSGNVYVADLVSTAVNKLDYSDPPSLSFATTAAGSTSSGSPKTVTVANDGNQTLTFSAVSYGTDFPEAPGVATDCTTSTNLASGASCTLSVDFSPLGPSATGTSTSLSEGLGLTDNANGSPQSITLSGTETVPPPFGVMTAPADAVTGSNTVTQGDGVLVTGWAADVHDGAPVHQVSILIDGTAVGNATLGIARPGIATEYGSAYLNSGWTYTYSGSLAAGTHTMTVVLYDSLGLSTQLPTHTFTVSSASAPPYGALTQAVDAITKTTPIGQNDGLLVTGWAADLVQGAPVSQVTVFIDGTSVGNATLSVAGPSGEPANSGWTFTDATLNDRNAYGQRGGL